MYPQFTFLIPTKIYYGFGEFKKVADRVREIGGEKILVVTDPVIGKTDFTQSMLQSLEENGFIYKVYDNVEPNPAVRHVEEGLQMAKGFGCELIIGIGGGSALDTAKAIAVMMTNEGKIGDYWGNPPKNAAMPVIAIPTTAGTSSEITWVTVVKDEEKKVKMGIGSPKLAPAIAIYDPEVTKTMPPGITASTGMDALTHAIEAYTNINNNPVAELAALEAVRLISENLRPAVAKGDNLKARHGVLLGTLFAGIAFANAVLGVVHAITSPLGGYFPVPHGVVNAILLPPAMEYNKNACIDKFVKIAEAMGENIEGLSKLEAADKAIEAVKRLSKDVGIPESLSEIGVKEELLPEIAAEAIKNVNIPLNPRQPSEKDLIQICKAVI
ncbi:MAG: iron-containing alcohol dehydrogenase [Dethiobacteria bacterium]|jgi:alcohol dehydrogenase class IV|nr:iron-containing alcohol dehydrogenase [Bacillota bacterium]